MRRLQEADRDMSRIRHQVSSGGQAEGYKLINGILFYKQKRGKCYDPEQQFRLAVPPGMISLPIFGVVCVCKGTCTRRDNVNVKCKAVQVMKKGESISDTKIKESKRKNG